MEKITRRPLPHDEGKATPYPNGEGEEHREARGQEQDCTYGWDRDHTRDKWADSGWERVWDHVLHRYSRRLGMRFTVEVGDDNGGWEPVAGPFATAELAVKESVDQRIPRGEPGEVTWRVMDTDGNQVEAGFGYYKDGTMGSLPKT
jgi:hypothetical protein